MKQMQKEKYEAPLTDRCLVALESGICAGSADITNSESGETGQVEEHEKNDDFGFTFDNQGWD